MPSTMALKTFFISIGKPHLIHLWIAFMSFSLQQLYHKLAQLVINTTLCLSSFQSFTAEAKIPYGFFQCIFTSPMVVVSACFSVWSNSDYEQWCVPKLLWAPCTWTCSSVSESPIKLFPKPLLEDLNLKVSSQWLSQIQTTKLLILWSFCNRISKF